MENGKVHEVQKDRVVFRNSAGNEEVIEMDCIIIALPAAIHDGLVESLKGMGLPVLAVDPCQSPREYSEAALKGASIGREI